MSKAKKDYNELSVFPQRLYKTRTSLGITQNFLAKRCGVTRQTISDYEVGKTSPDVVTLKKIANCLGVTSDYLIDFSKNIKSPNEEIINAGENLGLSEDALFLLRGEVPPSLENIVDRLLEKYNPDMVNYDNLFSRDSRRTRDVINLLIEDYIDATKKDEDNLLEYLSRFYSELISTNGEYQIMTMDFETNNFGDKIEAKKIMVMPTPKIGNERKIFDIYAKNISIKSLIVSSHINDISAYLTNYKKQVLKESEIDET